MANESTDYSIYCDETWTSPDMRLGFPCFVFYGLLLTKEIESQLCKELREYKESHGLFIDGKYVELKWADADKGYKSSEKTGKPNRYEEYIDIFFDYLKREKIGFGYLFLSQSDYQRIEPEFITSHNCGKHDFFFMLYFQFLYHCFIKNQTKHNKLDIFIDDRNMGAEGVRYDINLLRSCLNKRLYLDAAPRMQIPLNKELRKQFEESIQLISMESSSDSNVIQISDLSAGCVRYSIENKVKPPPKIGQLTLFTNDEKEVDEEESSKSKLSKYFYTRLRQIDKYKDIQLDKPSYHHRFNIFPFSFI